MNDFMANSASEVALPSKRSENGAVKRDEVDLKSQPTISRFFGKKNMTKHDDSIGKSNEIHDKY